MATEALDQIVHIPAGAAPRIRWFYPWGVVGWRLESRARGMA
jgi:hypothetical protein